MTLTPFQQISADFEGVSFYHTMQYITHCTNIAFKVSIEMDVIWTFRKHPRWPVKNMIWIDLTKLTRKHLCRSIFINKILECRPATLLKKIHQHRCFHESFAKFSMKHLCRTPLTIISEYVWSFAWLGILFMGVFTFFKFCKWYQIAQSVSYHYLQDK